MSRLPYVVWSAVLCALALTGCAAEPGPPAADRPSASPASSLSSSPIRDEFGTRQDQATERLALCYRWHTQRGEVEQCGGELTTMTLLGQEMRERISTLPNADRYRTVVASLDRFQAASEGYGSAECWRGYTAGSTPCSGLYTEMAVAWTGMSIELLTVEGTDS
ncbi:hypothetical protein ACFQE5_22260 [Pseudonocardia hispaniensis]|uniref:Lipoprotein n=1 Tax=Pseudonocardia hispaniensis TaxID=904933 RepID=A0ABW1J7S2_9PSEU